LIGRDAEGQKTPGRSFTRSLDAAGNQQDEVRLKGQTAYVLPAFLVGSEAADHGLPQVASESEVVDEPGRPGAGEPVEDEPVVVKCGNLSANVWAVRAGSIEAENCDVLEPARGANRLGAVVRRPGDGALAARGREPDAAAIPRRSPPVVLRSPPKDERAWLEAESVDSLVSRP